MLCCLAKKCLANISQKNLCSRFFLWRCCCCWTSSGRGSTWEKWGEKRIGPKNCKQIRRAALCCTLICLVVARPPPSAATSSTTAAATAATTTTFEGGQNWLGHPLVKLRRSTKKLAHSGWLGYREEFSVFWSREVAFFWSKTQQRLTVGGGGLFYKILNMCKKAQWKLARAMKKKM